MPLDLPPRMEGDIRGWLTFRSPLPAELQAAEDSTQWADASGNRGARFERPATATERTLLSELGYTLPADLTTCVHWVTRSVRRRTWPQLEDPTP